jgi:hypothetical protein
MPLTTVLPLARHRYPHAMKIAAQGGDTFRVHRRWLPWQPRTRDLNPADASPWDIPDLDGELPVLAVVLVAVAVVILLPVILIGLLMLGEVLVLLLLLPVFVLARVAFGKPWIVEVVEGRRIVYAEPVVGWRAAGNRMRELAAEIQTRPGVPATPECGRASIP